MWWQRGWAKCGGSGARIPSRSAIGRSYRDARSVDGLATPTANVCDQFVGALRPPRTRLVDVRFVRSDHVLYDPPRELDRVLTCKQCGVAGHRVTEQTFVIAESAILALLQQIRQAQVDRLTVHPFAAAFGARANRNTDGRVEADTYGVGARGQNAGEDVLRRLLERDDHFRQRLRQRLPGADDERHVGATPGVDLQRCRRVRGHLRYR